MSAARARFIGSSIERKEDYRFLTGAGQYTDDISLPRQSYARFLRSPHAHARTGCFGSFIGLPSMDLISQPQGSPPTPARSLPVNTPSTPGAPRAAAVSIARILACAWGLRRKQA